MDPYNHLNFSKISSKVAPGGRQHMALAAFPTQDLVMAALTSCSLKFLRAFEMAWYHCSNQTESFSLSVPKNQGIPGILSKMGWPMTPSVTGLVTGLW